VHPPVGSQRRDAKVPLHATPTQTAQEAMDDGVCEKRRVGRSTSWTPASTTKHPRRGRGTTTATTPLERDAVRRCAPPATGTSRPEPPIRGASPTRCTTPVPTSPGSTTGDRRRWTPPRSATRAWSTCPTGCLSPYASTGAPGWTSTVRTEPGRCRSTGRAWTCTEPSCYGGSTSGTPPGGRSR